MSAQPSDDELRATFQSLGFVTSSVKVLPLLRLARKAAEVSDVTILLEGETGTGKQVLAQGMVPNENSVQPTADVIPRGEPLS